MLSCLIRSDGSAGVCKNPCNMIMIYQYEGVGGWDFIDFDSRGASSASAITADDITSLKLDKLCD